MSKKYDEYLDSHIKCVVDGFNWLTSNLPEIFLDKDQQDDINKHIKEHDKSKYDSNEYEAYDKYFYGKNKSYEVVRAFNKAWLMHIHKNPHHWQHWILINDNPNEGEIILDMPDNYIIEMICDWWSFSWRTGDLHEIFKWYSERKNYIKLSDSTREKVENILDSIEEKLYEQEKRG